MKSKLIQNNENVALPHRKINVDLFMTNLVQVLLQVNQIGFLSECIDCVSGSSLVLKWSQYWICITPYILIPAVENVVGAYSCN